MHIAKTTAVSLISVLNPTLIMQSSEECWALSFVQDCWIRLHLFLTGWKTFKLKKNQTYNGRNNFGEVKIYILPVKLMHAGLNLFNQKTNPYTQCLFKSTTTLCAGCNKLGEKNWQHKTSAAHHQKIYNHQFNSHAFFLAGSPERARNIGRTASAPRATATNGR